MAQTHFRKVTRIKEELEYRINADTQFFNGCMPERFALAWRGYLSAVLEWGVIDVTSYDRLLKLVPDVEDDPVVANMMGREDDETIDSFSKQA